MIESIIEAEDCSKQALSVILYQLSRKHSDNYPQASLDNNLDLRAHLGKKVLEEAKSLAPYASEENWIEAANYLNSRGR